MNLFLDVDGVISPVADNLAPTTGFGDFRQAEVWGFAIWWSPMMISEIIDLSRDVQVRWLTTWGHEAVTELSPVLGLPEFPVEATLSLVDLSLPWWKLRAVQRHQPPFVWVDDDIADSPEAQDYALETNSLAIAPFVDVGLTPDHIAQIRQFIEVTL